MGENGAVSGEEFGVQSRIEPLKDLGSRTHVMGVLNVTPDSFSDGGLFANHAAALQHARDMEREGADIIDVGGESTRPGYVPVGAEEEQRRVLSVIRDLAPVLDVPISIDTYRAGTARAALDAGARIVNDILTYDDLTLEGGALTLPHPHLHERAFVLVPLAEIAPDLAVRGRRVEDWLAGLGVDGIAKMA